MKILLVKLNHLGDTLLLTPTIDFLSRRFPGLRLDVMVRSGCEEVLRGHPALTNLVSIASPDEGGRSFATSLREGWQALRAVYRGGYDYAFALTESDRSIFWLWLARARVRGINDADNLLGWKRRLFTHVSRFDWARQHQVLKDFRTVAEVIEPSAEPGPLSFHPHIDEGALRQKLPFLNEAEEFAVIHPTSRWAYKQWLPERWAVVADRLRDRYRLPVVFSCGPSRRERESVRQIQALARAEHWSSEGGLTLHELGHLLARARLFLGVDTVAMHLAAAMQTSTVALFGPSSEWSWHPWQCRHELALGECTCKATRRFVCDKSRPYPCMERITSDAVLAAAERLLQCPEGELGT